MKAISHLPAGYRQIDSIDLQKDKKAALTVNALALLIGAAMILGANLFVPIASLFTGSDNLTVGLRFWCWASPSSLICFCTSWSTALS